MNGLEKTIIETFCSKFKDKINKEERYNPYISSFTKERLERLLKINALVENDNNSFARVFAISVHKKNIIVDEVNQNLKNIYENIIRITSEDILKQLGRYLKEYGNNDVMEIDLTKLNYSLHFVELLNTNCIAKVKFLKKEFKLYLYTPIEIREILKTILNNISLIKEVKKISIYKNNLHNLISTYGVIPLKKLNNIYNYTYEKLEEDNLIQIIMNSLFDDDISLINTDDGYLAYGVGFDNYEEALVFYYSLPDDLDYKMYTKKEYEKIGKTTYHHQFNEFIDLYNFLEFNLNMDDEEIYGFDNMFVVDYIFSYQIDHDIAKKNLSINLKKYFMNLDFMDIAFISKSILSIARNYPSFNYKGYTYNEIKNKLTQKN